MYFGDAISDPYYEGENINNDLHPCRRCGGERQARAAWTFCRDCRAVDPEMCGVTYRGRPVRTRFYDGEDDDDATDTGSDERLALSA